MADNYIVQDQARTVQVLGAGQVNDVMQVSALTRPHGVAFTVEVPYKDWLAGFSAFSLGGQAAFIEGAFAEPYVVGAVGVQDVNPGTGLLDYFVDFTLQVPPPQGVAGTMQTTARLQPSVLPLAIDYNAIFAPYLAALNATANL